MARVVRVVGRLMNVVKQDHRLTGLGIAHFDSIGIAWLGVGDVTLGPVLR
ncbi:MAG: hypothetical protein ABI580_12770 [Burkholderiaceae bacterium]